MSVKQEPLSEIIANEIRHRIWEGQIGFGERLLESQLATEFDVSRSSLREAIHILEFEGLIQNRLRRGTFVSTFTEEDMKEVTEVRSILETKAFINAVSSMGEEDFNHLKSITESMKENTEKGNWTIVFNLDMEFHLYVVSLSNNTRIQKLYDIIQVQIRTLMSNLVPYYEKNLNLFYEEHLELIEVLASKDPLKVEKVVEKHIFDSCTTMIEMYKIQSKQTAGGME